MPRDAIRRKHERIRDAGSQIPRSNAPVPKVKPENTIEGRATVTFDARHANDIDTIASGGSETTIFAVPDINTGSFEYIVPLGNRFILRGLKYSFKTIYNNASDVVTSIFQDGKVISPLESISVVQNEIELIPAYYIFEAGETVKIQTVRTLPASPPLIERGYIATFYGNLIELIKTPINRTAFKE